MERVRDTEDLRRIRNLPRRNWREHPIPELIRLYTDALKTPKGTMHLLPVQAVALAELHDYGGTFAPIPVSRGKAIPDSEPVLHEHGWVPIGQVRPGERVYGSDGMLHQVIGVYPQGERDVYEITFSDRTTALCDLDHLWTVRDNHKAYGKQARLETLRLRDIVDEPLYRTAGGSKAKIWRYFLPMTRPVQYPAQRLPLDPYTLGALLGDGGLTQPTKSFTTMDADILANLVLPAGVTPRRTSHQNSGRATQYNLTQDADKRGPTHTNPLRRILLELGLDGCSSHTKFIPRTYLTGSVDQRLALLQGLLDTDGEYARACDVGYSTVSTRLANDVQELAESLGASVTLAPRHNHIRLTIRLPRGVVPFRCERKARPWAAERHKRRAPPGRSIRAIKWHSRADCTCIAVYSPDHLFHLRHNILTHNTLVSLLAPVVVGAERPILVVPAALRDKTKREVREDYAPHWQLPRMPIHSYHNLSRDLDNEILMTLQPDLLVFDEADKLKNPGAACTKKVKAYLKWARKQGREVRLVMMSGTLLGRGLDDYWHLIRWTLGDLAPVPKSWPEMREWGQALNSRVDEWARLAPGPLVTLGQVPDDVEGDLEVARAAFGDRLRSTPGVVSVDGEPIAVPVEVTSRILTLPSELDEHFRHLRDEWETPDGHPFEDAMTLWRHAREMACGMFGIWDPRPPADWVDARKQWHALAREMTKSKYDSPGHVAAAIDRGDFADGGVLRRWREIRDTFKPNPVPVWVDDTALNDAATWLSDNEGLVWVEHRAFGRRLSEMTGAPWFAEKATDQQGRRLDAGYRGPAVCQVEPCSTGLNLQHGWSKNLIVSCTPTGRQYEQLIGRTCRPGQPSRVVTVEHQFGCIEQLGGFWKSFGDAVYARETGLHIIEQAALDVPTLGEVRSLGPAWVK